MTGTQRWVLHMDMDSFFASVEQLTRPTLRGRPVLVGGAGPRGVVAGASYEARAYGAHSAMPMHQARRLVGLRAVVVPPRGRLYRLASRRVFAVVRGLVPVIEQLSLDEAFAEPGELEGAGTADVERFCARLRDAVFEETGLVASVGAGSGKQVAKIASGLAKPRGQRVIALSRERAEMDPLPVRKLWGIGPVADERLRKVGVESIGQFAALGHAEVVSLLGSTVGPALHALARGVDDRPVAERAEAKQVSAETTFAADLLTRREIRDAVQATGEAAHRRLLHDGRGARTVIAKFRKSDMSTVTRSKTLAYATTDRAVLIAAAQKAAVDPGEVGPIRLVGVGFAGLTALQQTVLFPQFDSADADESGDRGVGGDVGGGGDVGVGDDVGVGAGDARAAARRPLSAGDDVRHPDRGHGWVQGSGHGVVTVRFETRSSGPGPVVTLPAGDPALAVADPVASLDWPERWTVAEDTDPTGTGTDLA
ncbi:DNA polymerase IV [Tomitella gaofuii]|uniref:DNA polymerase IV n=1 Tax=Tomitella gaofuii TaxID=2760083 RepID=UPI002E2A87E1|nr:DNA polymerase IV [Tomitella gaofuii]